MKLLILTICVAHTLADVSHIVPKDEKDAPIVKQELDVGPEGNYQYSYETGNGIVASERGELTNAGSENAAIAVQGEASWDTPDGQRVQFQYRADENGYQPQSSAIPTPHPIPEYIIRSLEYIRAHPPSTERP